MDDKTLLIPDILVVCDRGKLQNGLVFGAPDFVIEILSPSTRKRDMTLKLQKYAEAGVREYWIVDPEKKRVMVHDFKDFELPELYAFEHTIPVRIFDGKCTIDFKEIFDYIEFLYHKQ